MENEWNYKNVKNAIINIFRKIRVDMQNYDKNNESEIVVLKSNYFSSYKGLFVIRTNIKRSGSIGILLISRFANNRKHPEDEVRHEYGHTIQLKRMGLFKYIAYIGLPSLLNLGSGSYYDKPWEITADIYGEVKSRIHTKQKIAIGDEYLKRRS